MNGLGESSLKSSGKDGSREADGDAANGLNGFAGVAGVIGLLIGVAGVVDCNGAVT